MRYYKEQNIHIAFKKILDDLWNDPDYIAAPREMEVREIRDCSIEIKNPMKNIYTHPIRSSPLKYIAAEILFYFSGTNNPGFIENYASLWKKIHNPNGTVNSSYGNLIFKEKNEYDVTQYNWVIESLKRDKDSRQAFMHFNKPQHQWFGNKDQVCTLQSLFHIRDNKLHMTLTMRSNDVIYGFMTDWAFFSVLQYHVYLHMKQYYPELEMGSYTHISHSMHLYERHYDLVEKMVGSNYINKDSFIADELPLLSEPVIDETGRPHDKYPFLGMIMKGEKPNFNAVYYTDNPLIDWCIEKLKE